MVKNYKYLNRLVTKRDSIFVAAASLASIASLVGWAGEKFLGATSPSIAITVLLVMGLFFVLSLFMGIASWIALEKAKDVQENHELSHRITHHLRNATKSLREIDFQTKSKLESTSTESHINDVVEISSLQTKDIFKRFGAKVTGAVARQLKNHFSVIGSSDNIRVTIKSINPIGNDQEDWQVDTLILDPDTWQNTNRQHSQASALHTITPNTAKNRLTLKVKTSQPHRFSSGGHHEPPDSHPTLGTPKP